MRLMKQAMAVLGTVVVIAVVLVLVTPKTAHSIAAAMVEIVPGATTHLGTTESNLVSLVCNLGAVPSGGGTSGVCDAVDATGGVNRSGYQVPTGFTLIVTDYEWQQTVALQSNAFSPTVPNTYLRDFFESITGSSSELFFPVPLLPQQSCALADKSGLAYGREHFTTGIRVASGLTIYDNLSSLSVGSAALQGYLVPN